MTPPSRHAPEHPWMPPQPWMPWIVLLVALLEDGLPRSITRLVDSRRNNVVICRAARYEEARKAKAIEETRKAKEAKEAGKHHGGSATPPEEPAASDPVPN